MEMITFKRLLLGAFSSLSVSVMPNGEACFSSFSRQPEAVYKVRRTGKKKRSCFISCLCVKPDRRVSGAGCIFRER